MMCLGGLAENIVHLRMLEDSCYKDRRGWSIFWQRAKCENKILLSSMYLEYFAYEHLYGTRYL